MSVLDRFRLDGKVAVVTGASSGLGVAFAQALAEAGGDVALGARRVEKLEDTRKLVENAGRRAIAVATDVAKPEDCAALVEAAMSEFGHVDILVNSAGVFPFGPTESLDEATFDDVYDLNVKAPFFLVAALAPAMAARGTGTIVNLSTMVAQFGASGEHIAGFRRPLRREEKAS